MNGISSNSVRFVKMCLRDYGIFLGLNEFDFDRHRTLITGNGGTGKTTIFNALAQLGPAKGVKANICSKHPEMSVNVVTEGNRNLITEYRSVIFLSCEGEELPVFSPEESILDHRDLKATANEARQIFQTMLNRKPAELEPHGDLIPRSMAAGERVCLVYAFAFAIRKVLNLDLPIVLDSPYCKLDLEKRQAVRAFLKDQPYQQILLGSKLEFDGEDRPHYTLEEK